MSDFPKTAEFENAFGPPSLVEDELYVDGKWTRTTPSNPPLRNGGGHANPSVEFAVNYSHWAQESFRGSVVEVWACTDGGQLGAALETWRVALWQGNPAIRRGYLLYYGGGIGKSFGLRRYDGSGSFTDIDGAGGGYPERIGLRLTPETLEVWGMYSGTWSLMVTNGDTTYRDGPWFLGLGIEEQGGINELSIDCFGGGSFHRTQFFRWTRGYKEPVR